MTQNIYTIILAGGSGQRMGGNLPKQFLPLGERPVIIETISRFSSLEEVTGILVVIPEQYRPLTEEILKSHPEPKVLALITGGASRRESAWNALAARDFSPDDIILVHDAARPFVSAVSIRGCIEGASRSGAAGLYLPASDTITEIHDEQVTAIPDRSSLYYTQTPQAFRYDVLERGHRAARDHPEKPWTDDVSLVLALGEPVQAVPGDPQNIKVTTPFDYELAQWLTGRATNG